MTDPEADEDPVVVDMSDLDEISVDSRPTKPMPFTRGARLEIDLDDPCGMASFLEAVARILREKRRVVLIVE